MYKNKIVRSFHLQLREARRQEQANNPHYLKDDSPRSYQQEDVPIAEIALEIPLKVHSKLSKVSIIRKNDVVFFLTVL